MDFLPVRFSGVASVTVSTMSPDSNCVSVSIGYSESVLNVDSLCCLGLRAVTTLFQLRLGFHDGETGVVNGIVLLVASIIRNSTNYFFGVVTPCEGKLGKCPIAF